jgi:hypothetical protein
LYLRNLPARLVRDAKMKAARDGMTLTAVVVDALARWLDAPAADRASAEDTLRESMAWYEEHRARLLRRYPGEFVAILDRAVIDHDTRFDALATRVFERMGAPDRSSCRVSPRAVNPVESDLPGAARREPRDPDVFLTCIRC